MAIAWGATCWVEWRNMKEGGSSWSWICQCAMAALMSIGLSIGGFLAAR